MKTILPFAIFLLTVASPARAEDELVLDGVTLRETPHAIEDVRVIELSDAPTRLVLWNERTADGALLPHYRISLDGETWSRTRSTSYDVRLRYAEFDPLVSTPDVSAHAVPRDGGLFVVQYVTQPLEAFRRALEERGATVHRYLADHAHLAHLPGNLVDEVSALPFVRWVGPYHPAYRLEGSLLSALDEGTLPESRRYVVQVMERGPAMKGAVAARLEALGGTIDANHAEGFLLHATLSPSQLAELLTWDEVLWVDGWSPPRAYMNNVRADGGANFLESMTGYTGQGVAGEVLDTGVLANHQDFSSVLLHNGNDSNKGHGTAVAGIVFGDGTGSASARGLLPDGKHVFSSFFNLSNRYTHTAELLVAPYRCVFQTNSWGYGYDQYTNLTTQLDDIAFQYDIVICQAQGNSGGPSSEQLSWAKNVLSVGGIIHQNTLSTADDFHGGSGGSTGPAPDGRVKPDLSFWYDSIRTTSDSGGYTNSFGGTSAATPETAGYMGLFMQLWSEDVFGTSPGKPTVFGNRPKQTTAKAMLINSADQYPFSGGTHDLKRVRQGWGRPNVERLYDDRDTYFVVDETEVLTNLSSVSYDLEVPPGEDEFRATLVYLDPAGTTSSSQHRINDLTLRVTSPDGSQYWGNRGMKTNNFNVTGGNSNTKDTVENVWVDGPLAGTWTVEVLADEVNQDAHVETGATDVDFALVVSGVVDGACPDPTSYCTTSSNSVGTGAVMGFSGSASLSANDLVLTCDALPTGQFGLFFHGPSQQSKGLGDGTLCVGGTLVRLPVVTTTASGDASWSFDVTGTGLQAGDTRNFQFWYRDPTGGPAGNNLSDGLSATFCN